MRIGIFVCVAVLMSALVQVNAAPLDAESCNRLKGEQTQLEQAGIRGSMVKGPQWAQANLGADKLQQIRRLIEVEEQLLFRCTGRTLVELPPETEADPAAPANEAADDAKETPADAKAAERKPAPRASEHKKGDVAKAAPGAGAAKPAPGKPPSDPKAKPAATAKAPAVADKPAAAKPKPKPNDAYKPPPADLKLNPFTTETSKD